MRSLAKSVEFLFDFMSPYSYFAWRQIVRLKERNVRVELVPVDYHGIVAGSANVGNGAVLAKREYLVHDCFRLAAHIKVPFVLPPKFPFLSNPALQAAWRVSGERRAEFVKHVFERAWANKILVEDPVVVAELLAVCGGPECSEAEGQSRLKHATDRAIERGAFGVPTFFWDNEIYWGNDSLPYLEGRIRGDAGTPSELVDEWHQLWRDHFTTKEAP